MADIFDVVADPTRRDLLTALLERYVSPDSETGDISVGDLVDALGLSQPTVSKHLKVLRDHGLVSVREDGQQYFVLVLPQGLWQHTISLLVYPVLLLVGSPCSQKAFLFSPDPTTVGVLSRSLASHSVSVPLV